jgi:hypothetical protein
MLARHPLLEGIVDYAGLFPPASLPMRPAVETYARHRAGAEAWMLAAFVVPVSRLQEFGDAVRALSDPGDQPWPLSLLLAADPSGDLELADAYLRAHRGLGEVVAVEWRPADAASIAEVVAAVPAGAQAFCELPWDRDVKALLAAVRAAGALAKIRTGGLTEDLVPPVEAVATFLRACHDLDVGLKFTAGLHHPVRARHPLSYAADAPVATMHGFLNAFVAAALIAEGDIDDHTLRSVLRESDPRAFALGVDGSVRWRAHHLDPGAVRRARARFARSFGSCSFDDPVHDLQKLG